MKTSRKTNAKRSLDLSSDDSNVPTTTTTKVAKNPYIKKPPPSESTSATANTAANVKGAYSTVTVTPDTDAAKFSAGRRNNSRRDDHHDDDASTKLLTPRRVARKLVTPERDGNERAIEAPEARDLIKEDDERKQRGTAIKRKSLRFAVATGDTTDDVVSNLYYDSDEGAKSTKKMKTKVDEGAFVPVHIHSNVDYYRRGELALDQGKLRAYRFIRNNFLVPIDIETDPKFGPLSGICFEERVIRAYSLGQLKPKNDGQGGSGRSLSLLLVCSYCGDEGHKRDGCAKLL